MILILSTHGDHTTDEVIDWLNYNQVPFIRLNDNDLIENILFTIEFSTSNNYIKGLPLTNEVRVAWFRKFGFFNNSKIAQELVGNFNSDQVNHLLFEYRTFLEAIPSFYQDVPWLMLPTSVNINKVKSLLIARKAGLTIPDTFLTTDKESVRKAISNNQPIISKSIREGKNIAYNKKMYTMFTELIEEDNIDSITDSFFPSLIQNCLDKEYEIRTFYLDGLCYSMAIFSQLDEQTKIDFRKYNREKPNRYVPFQLPKEVENNIDSFMKEMKLNTGSLDIVKTKDGKYVFLEVNPVGQFGMVSNSCNYFLEEKVAEYFMKFNTNYTDGK